MFYSSKVTSRPVREVLTQHCFHEVVLAIFIRQCACMWYVFRSCLKSTSDCFKCSLLDTEYSSHKIVATLKQYTQKSTHLNIHQICIGIRHNHRLTNKKEKFINLTGFDFITSSSRNEVWNFNKNQKFYINEHFLFLPYTVTHTLTYICVYVFLCFCVCLCVCIHVSFYVTTVIQWQVVDTWF